MSAPQAERTLRRLEKDIFPWIGKKNIAQIKPPELLEVIKRIKERGGLETAHRAMGNCGQVFRYGVQTGKCERDITCNSWYNFHYSLNQDRAHVDQLKTEFGNSNKLYAEFNRRFANGSSKDEKSFLSLLELLHYSLNQAELQPAKFHNSKRLTLQYLLIDFAQKDDPAAYWDCIIPNALKKDGTFKANLTGIIVDSNLVFSADNERVFAGLIELIYQVRCALVHGDLAPTHENHEVVKYCYLVLFELMRGFCE